MASLQSYYNKFFQNIRLEYQSDAYKQVKDKDDSISPKITQAFKEAGYVVESTLKLGSMAVGTSIKPINGGDYDLDKGFVITYDSSPENPIAPKEIIHEVLGNHGFTNHKIKTPCVTADYASINMHIDYTVFRPQEYGGIHELAVGKKHAKEPKWDENDPTGLINWINDNQYHKAWWHSLDEEEVAQFKTIVRYLKRWRDVNFCDSDRKRIYSIALTIMAKEQFAPSIDEEGNRNDHEALQNTIKNILEHNYFVNIGNDKFEISINLPVAPRREVFQQHKSVGTVFKERLEKMHNKLIEVNKTDNLEEKTEILNKLFGEDFPIHSETKESANSLHKFSGPGFVQDHGGA